MPIIKEWSLTISLLDGRLKAIGSDANTIKPVLLLHFNDKVIKNKGMQRTLISMLISA